MRNPKRVLEKILENPALAEPLQATGEPLDQVIEVFRDVQKCRKARSWILERSGIDVAVSSETFFQLLKIPEINRVETTNRDLEVEVIELSDTRQPGDPVSVGNLNTTLRELYRDLENVRGKIVSDFEGSLMLAEEMTREAVDSVDRWTTGLREMNWNGLSFLASSWKAGRIENEFRSAFPQTPQAHPLRQTLPRIEKEMELFRRARDLEKKWAELNLDLFQLIRAKALENVAHNLEELGNKLWNIVYQSPTVAQSMAQAGIHFADVRTLFDNANIRTQ